MRIKLSKQAQSDLDEIWHYAAQASSSFDTADRLTDTITERFALFARFPLIGKKIENGKLLNARTFSAGSYVIFYSIQREHVLILRIIHSSRDAFAAFSAEWS